MAQQLRVAVATVSRAYAEVRRRGLTDARVGRGTFVRRQPDHERQESRGYDLSVSSLEPLRHASEIFDCFRQVSGQSPALLRYPPTAGLQAHRAAASEWLRRLGLDCPPEGVLVSAGAQHGLAAVLTVLASPGDVVLVEELTYHGMRSLAGVLGIRLHGVAMDREGLIPEALAEAGRVTNCRVLYCIPTLQNPTSAVASESRRQAIVGVSRSLDLTIIEDDVYGPLVPQVPHLATLAPERTVYIASAAKSLAAALRIGFVAAPGHLLAGIEHALGAMSLAASPILADAFRHLVSHGVADRIIEWKRQELAARQKIVARVCAGLGFQTHPVSQNVWLRLPDPWTADTFAARAQLAGVTVSPASGFAVDAPAPKAVRFSIGPPETHAQLERALTTIRAILRGELVPRRVI